MENTINNDERQELERLRAQVASLKQSATLRFKVSEKGAVSVYGMGRFPVTLYKGQWDRLIDSIDALKSFITANESALSVK